MMLSALTTPPIASLSRGYERFYCSTRTWIVVSLPPALILTDANRFLARRTRQVRPDRDGVNLPAVYDFETATEPEAEKRWISVPDSIRIHTKYFCCHHATCRVGLPVLTFTWGSNRFLIHTAVIDREVLSVVFTIFTAMWYAQLKLSPDCRTVRWKTYVWLYAMEMLSVRYCKKRVRTLKDRRKCTCKNTAETNDTPSAVSTKVPYSDRSRWTSCVISQKR